MFEYPDFRIRIKCIIRKKTNLLTVVKLKQRHSHYFLTPFSHKRSQRKKGVGVQRDKEEEETNRKIRVKGKCVFSCMCFFNGVCREIEGV